MKEEAKMLCFDQKKTHQRWKHITPLDFAEHIRKSGVSENRKVYILLDFYEMDFMKSIVILVKVDEMYNILKSASHCLLVERRR